MLSPLLLVKESHSLHLLIVRPFMRLLVIISTCLCIMDSLCPLVLANRVIRSIMLLHAVCSSPMNFMLMSVSTLRITLHRAHLDSSNHSYHAGLHAFGCMLLPSYLRLPSLLPVYK